MKMKVIPPGDYTSDTWAEIIAAENAAIKKANLIKGHYKKMLKPLINTHILYRWLNENESWEPVGIFNIKIETKYNHYYSKEMICGKAIGIPAPEMHRQEESTSETGANHIFINQVTHNEDCYYGHIAIPLLNRKYFLIRFHC